LLFKTQFESIDESQIVPIHGIVVVVVVGTDVQLEHADV
jgi:hypothetical protein